MMMKLQAYDLIVSYKAGKLSFNSIISGVGIKIKVETREDSTLQKIIEYYVNGWPKHKSKVRDDVKCFYQVRNEIHVVDEISLSKFVYHYTNEVEARNSK